MILPHPSRVCGGKMSVISPHGQNSWELVHTDFACLALDAPIHAAAQQNRVDRIQEMSRGGYPVNNWYNGLTPLHVASIHGHLQAVRALLEAGADPCAETELSVKYRSPLLIALANREADIVLTMARFTPGFNDNHRAAITNDADTVSANGVSSPAGCNITPLHFAVFFGRVEAVAALIRAGAELEARAGPSELTPLFMSAIPHTPRIEIVRKLLLDAGADVNTRSANGKCLLQCADKEFAELLLSRGATPLSTTAQSYGVWNVLKGVSDIMRIFC